MDFHTISVLINLIMFHWIYLVLISCLVFFCAAPLNLNPVTDFDKIVNELRLQYKRICIQFHVRDVRMQQCRFFFLCWTWINVVTICYSLFMQGTRRPTQGAARMIFNFMFSVSLSFLRLYQRRSSCLPRRRLEYFVVEVIFSHHFYSCAIPFLSRIVGLSWIVDLFLNVYLNG